MSILNQNISFCMTVLFLESFRQVYLAGRCCAGHDFHVKLHGLLVGKLKKKPIKAWSELFLPLKDRILKQRAK